MSTEITRATAIAIQSEIKDALAPILAKYGLAVTKQKAKFDAGSFSVSISTALTAAEDGALFNPNAPECKAYVMYAEMEGLPADGLGSTFIFRGVRHTILGYNPRAPKFAILAKSERDGKTYRFPVATVKAGLQGVTA